MTRMRSFILLSLLLLSALWQHAESRSFPSTPDATEATQQRWGSVQAGYVTEGCWHRPSATTTVTLEPCRAFALETDGEVPALKGLSEGALPLTYSAGDGTYWLGGRSWPGLTLPGWTCLDGRHICWLRADTSPSIPSGLVLLGKTTVSAGAVGEFVILAPWSRPTPYQIPAGVTLVFGVCPAVGPQPLFQGSGLVRFAPGACAAAFPEWWGADPQGLIDATAAWTTAIAATTEIAETRGMVPLACRGVYRLASSGATSIALTIPAGTQILGSYYTPGGGNPMTPCRFEYHGDGIALGNVYAGETQARIQLRNLQIYDVDGGGEKGLSLDGFSGNYIDNVLVRGFGVGAYFGPQFYYTEVHRLLLYGARTICLDLAGGVNGAFIDAQCSVTSNTTVTDGVRVGQTPGAFSTSSDLRLNVLVETHSGTPVSIDRVRGLDLTAYVEMPGNAANYTTSGAIWLRRIDGGRVHVRAAGNVTGGGTIPVGIRFYATPDVAGTGGLHNRNVVVSGHLRSFDTPVLTDKETGGWGVNLTGLAIEPASPPAAEDYAVFTTGVMLARNLITHGDAPQVDEGRGSTLGGSSWVQGDLIFATPQGDGRIGNLLRQVTVPGNPPDVQALLIPTLGAVRALDGVAIPTLLVGNTYMTRLIVDASATAITDLSPPIAGLCVDLLAAGARVITHGATIRLAGSTDYAMATGNTLRLCRDDGLGPWREYARCSTCS